MTKRTISQELVDAVVSGAVEPEDAARSLPNASSIESAEISSLDFSIISASQQRNTSGTGLIRLSRFNHFLAKETGDAEIIAQTGFTLSQMLLPYQEHAKECARLAEQAVPVLKNSIDSAEKMGWVFRHVAVAMNSAASIEKSVKTLQKAIKYGRRSLQSLRSMKNLPPGILTELNFIVGSRISDLPTMTEQDLEDSVAHLKAAVEGSKSMGDQHAVGASLNNLGNSLFLLGQRTGDEETLREAISKLKEALPFRGNEASLQRTKQIIANANSTLKALQETADEALNSTDAMSQQIAGERLLTQLIEGGTESNSEERQKTLKEALDNLSLALKRAQNQDNTELVARSELSIGMGLNEDSKMGMVILAICYLRSAERRFESLDRLQRLAASHHHLGKAFASFNDGSDKNSYISEAADNFEKACKEFSTCDQIPEALQSARYLYACYSIMGKDGDENALKKSAMLKILIRAFE